MENGITDVWLIRHKLTQIFAWDHKANDFFEADKKMVIADIGHFESEQFAKELIHSILIEIFSNFAVLISETNTNAVNYL